MYLVTIEKYKIIKTSLTKKLTICKIFVSKYGLKNECLHAKQCLHEIVQITSNYPRELRCVQKKKKKKKPTFSFTPMEHQIYKTRFRNFMNCNYLDHAGVEFVKMQI